MANNYRIISFYFLGGGVGVVYYSGLEWNNINTFWYKYGKYISIADAGNHNLKVNYKIIETLCFCTSSLEINQFHRYPKTSAYGISWDNWMAIHWLNIMIFILLLYNHWVFHLFALYRVHLSNKLTSWFELISMWSTFRPKFKSQVSQIQQFHLYMKMLCCVSVQHHFSTLTSNSCPTPATAPITLTKLSTNWGMWAILQAIKILDIS